MVLSTHSYSSIRFICALQPCGLEFLLFARGAAALRGLQVGHDGFTFTRLRSYRCSFTSRACNGVRAGQRSGNRLSTRRGLTFSSLGSSKTARVPQARFFVVEVMNHYSWVEDQQGVRTWLPLKTFSAVLAFPRLRPRCLLCAWKLLRAAAGRGRGWRQRWLGPDANTFSHPTRSEATQPSPAGAPAPSRTAPQTRSSHAEKTPSPPEALRCPSQAYTAAVKLGDFECCRTGSTANTRIGRGHQVRTRCKGDVEPESSQLSAFAAYSVLHTSAAHTMHVNGASGGGAENRLAPAGSASVGRCRPPGEAIRRTVLTVRTPRNRTL